MNKSAVKYPFHYYRQLFDLYRLEENAQLIPCPHSSTDKQPFPFSLVVLNRGNDQFRRSFLNTLRKQDQSPAEIIFLIPNYLPDQEKFTADLENNFNYPCQLVHTSLESLGAARNEGIQTASHDLILDNLPQSS